MDFFLGLPRTTKKIYKSYHMICLRVLTNLETMKNTSSSHPIFNKGGNGGINGML